ncbi:TD and POZ domain-containing protein 4 [Halotydeus destructor]|nr:TD and POZ domain-containing protein 4 [Halotydeus destructor]
MVVNGCYLRLHNMSPGKGEPLHPEIRERRFPALKGIGLILFHEKIGDIDKFTLSCDEALSAVTELKLRGHGIRPARHFPKYAICHLQPACSTERFPHILFAALCPTGYEEQRTCQSAVHMKHLEYILDNPDVSDVKLIADDGHMLAIKDILASQSTVLRAMFASDCREKSENEVRLEQVTISVLRAVVRFIYLDQVEFQNHVFAFEMCIVADRLNIKDLAHQAQDYLVTQLREDNAVTLLLSASNYLMEKLEQECIQFIGKRSRIKHSSVLTDFHLIASPSFLIHIIKTIDVSGRPCICRYLCPLETPCLYEQVQ